MTQKEINQEIANLKLDLNSLDRKEEELIDEIRSEKKEIKKRLSKLKTTVGDDIIYRRINIAENQLGVGFKFRANGRSMEILKVNKKTFQVNVSPSRGYEGYYKEGVTLIDKARFVEELGWCDKNQYDRLIKSYNRERNLDKVLS